MGKLLIDVSRNLQFRVLSYCVMSLTISLSMLKRGYRILEKTTREKVRQT
jgi:hypothetical protein